MDMVILDCLCGKEPIALLPALNDPCWSFVCRMCGIIESDKCKEVAIEKWDKAVREKKIDHCSPLTYPRQELALPTFEEQFGGPKEVRGWSMTQVVGMGVVNPKAMVRASGFSEIDPPKPETEEERVQRIIMEKSW